MIDILDHLGLQAANLGKNDFNYGFDFLLENMQKTQVKLISTNIVNKESGEPAALPYWIKQFNPTDHNALFGKKAIKVGILGVINPTFEFRLEKDKQNMQSLSFIRALQLKLSFLRRQCDVIIVLAALGLDQARNLPKSVNGIDVIISSEFPGALVPPQLLKDRQDRQVILCSPQDRGKSFDVLTLMLDEKKNIVDFTNLHTPLDTKVKENKAILRLVNDYEGKYQYLYRYNRFSKSGHIFYQGALGCKRCHEEQFTAWQATRHATAYNTLVQANADKNETCLPCHVTGYGKKSGFEQNNISLRKANVQCESCHGPGSLHISHPNNLYGKTDESTCIKCHTGDYGKDFNYKKYLKMIGCGRKKQ